MFYLISGKILSGIVFVIIFKLFNGYSDLVLTEKIAGWFFIDHIFEEYNFTSGKFFLINEDYRNLIKNLFVLCIFLWFFLQQFVLFEFFLFFVFLLLTRRINKNLLLSINYIFLFYTFLLVNFYLTQFTIIIYGLILCILVYYKFLVLVLIRECSISAIKRFILVFNLKSTVFLSFFVFCFLFFSCTNMNNFVLEEVLQILILYTYIYYF